jgi:putative NADH-flavin reductase
VVRQALDAGHAVTAVVRTPSKLDPETRARVALHTADLSAGLPPDVLSGQEVLINCAGHVRDAEIFVALVDRIVTAVDQLPVAEQPVSWFLAGAALLDFDSAGRRSVDLPAVQSIYWPHQRNLERLRRSHLDWRLLCPGPMVDRPALGVSRLRISRDVLPVEVPASADALTDFSWPPMFAALIPAMMVSYADAAAVMLANLDRGNAMSGHRVGLARRQRRLVVQQ